MNSEHLYIIGNGFDCYHGAKCSCTFEMRYQLHKWVNTLQYKKGFKKRLLDIDKHASFLTFNYTDFLESVYGISNDQINYIHGSRHDKYGSLVIGHSADDDENFESWIKRNEHRRRYRPNLKDAKGRYFANDKLVYLAYFLEDETRGNWRLPIRYYAAQNAKDRFEHYYVANMKPTKRIIEDNGKFFESLSMIKKITVIGHSLSKVDMPYFEKVIDSLSMVWMQFSIKMLMLKPVTLVAVAKEVCQWL